MQRSNNYYLKKIAELTKTSTNPSFEFDDDNGVIGYNLGDNTYAIATDERVIDIISAGNPQTVSSGFSTVDIYLVSNVSVLNQILNEYGSEIQVILQRNSSILTYITTIEE